MKILIVEDQESLAKIIQKGLKADGFTADYILDGEKAKKHIDINHSDYDLIILDVMLPNKSGIEILTEVRNQGITTPILLLTALNEENDIITGLNIGADDYLTKPFSLKELTARIRTILRRPKILVPNELIAGKVKLNPITKCVTCDSVPVHLTLKEFGLLEYLMRHPNESLTRDDMLANVWDFAFDSFGNVVDVHITNLRKKLNDKDASLIETIRGIGYKIKNN